MNIAKNMEAIFIAVAASVCFTSVASFAAAANPSHQAASAQILAQADGTRMPVVNVVGKRLSAAQKATLDN